MLHLNARNVGPMRSTQIVKNRFLQSLAPAEFAQLRPYLRPVDLNKNSVIHDEGKPIQFVYFIESGVVSRTVRTRADAPIEIAMVGNTGFIGLAAVLGAPVAIHRSVVLVSGAALRISAGDLHDVMERAPSIRPTLLHYAKLVMSQNSQLSLCNARHSSESRLARWFLLAQDHAGGDTLPLTHDLLANLLGVRRATVSGAMRSFQEAGILQGGRGTVRLLNRKLLRQRSCQCYSIIEEGSFWQRMPQHQHWLEDE